jgi:nitrite reductase/ring-hydroxylating ferredoxin subunit
MEQSVKACSVSDISEGTMRTIDVQGKRIAIAHIGNEFFAIDDTCSHEECSLGTEGLLEEQTVVCGCHGAQFDITTGDVLSLPATRPVQSYHVTIQDNQLYIVL